ncbi:MAG TPA: TraR/DksA family transcriptional regulator [Blastococcus sp.]|nr:TraR/DksA family transcriptional regulator [Blastococcus sp.]
MTTVLTVPSAPTTGVEPFRSLLLAQREDCLRQGELAVADTVAAHPDPVAATRAGVLADRIDAIDAALARLEAGTYGTCASCGDAIPRERLEFRPHAVSCVGCPQPRR